MTRRGIVRPAAWAVGCLAVAVLAPPAAAQPGGTTTTPGGTTTTKPGFIQLKPPAVPGSGTGTGTGTGMGTGTGTGTGMGTASGTTPATGLPQSPADFDRALLLDAFDTAIALADEFGLTFTDDLEFLLFVELIYEAKVQALLQSAGGTPGP